MVDVPPNHTTSDFDEKQNARAEGWTDVNPYKDDLSCPICGGSVTVVDLDNGEFGDQLFVSRELIDFWAACSPDWITELLEAVQDILVEKAPDKNGYEGCRFCDWVEDTNGEIEHEDSCEFLRLQKAANQ